MQRLTMLVTPDGDWVFPDSAEFLAALGDPDPDYDAVGFAVRNLGFIKFEIVNQTVIEIELHPRNVEQMALFSVQKQLLSSEIKLFRIKHFTGGDWRSEISSSADHAILRLTELCTPVYMPANTDRFTAQPLDTAVLFQSSSRQANPLRVIAQKWRISFGHFDLNVVAMAARHHLQMAIIGVKPRDRDPRFRFFGNGLPWASDDFKAGATGERVENMPDKEYGGWTAQFFRAVADSGQPRYDLVTALMRYQTEEGKPERLVRYERLLLPWRTPSEEVFITSCSKVVAKEGAPNLAPAEEDSSVIR